eukprot:CAMPEP_0181337100 /NCGR_PEP_ID=MMETSP1101-20121128/27815_1 /TAXON_ID=46948 /ORGANISM="Rhodomonas abbreviata, Strain Caron Lab Isolate" /LENGTH=104 /DNA_ID=CAMNT_0023447525 /DNA_START=292 /DNA_END=606 /DNA_ORIENTATION=-
MQANQGLSYTGALKEVWARNGPQMFWKGAEARVGLLLIVNILNEVLLKKAWQGVEVAKKEPHKKKTPTRKLTSRKEALSSRSVTALPRRPSIGGGCQGSIPQAA